MSERLDAALRFAQERGWPVLPLEGKVPAKGSHGHMDATTDVEQIQAWWEANPDRNVGVATGTVSGIVVVDVDGPEGEEALQELLDGSIPDTIEVSTPHGRHLYFEYPPNRPPIGREIGLRKQLDVLGNGGYVVGASSVDRVTGVIYTEVKSGNLAPLPEAVLSALHKRGGKEPFRVPKRLTEGTRNTTLFVLGAFMKNIGASDESIIAALTAENLARCDPPLDLTEVRHIAGSAAKREMTDPVEGLQFNILSDEELLTLADPEWLVHGFLPAGGLIVLYGKPASGKSFVALGWGMHTATGLAWLGSDVRPGPVLYVVAEGGTSFKQRVEAWHEYFQVRPPTGAFFLLQAVDLMDWDEVAELTMAAVAKMPAPPSLVIFDTLARSMPGGDENKQQDMGKAVAGADLVRRELKATVLLPHHSRRMDKEERGSSVLRGAADAMFLIENDSGKLTLSCSKMKDAEPSPRKYLELQRVGRSCVVTADPSRSLTLRERVLDFVTSSPGCTTTQVRASTGGKAETIGALLGQLATEGWVEDRGSGGKHQWHRTEDQ